MVPDRGSNTRGFAIRMARVSFHLLFKGVTKMSTEESLGNKKSLYAPKTCHTKRILGVSDLVSTPISNV